MPTKRFAWKDRDSAALDLIQLAYHAPQSISERALELLSLIRSEVIVTDLKEITLDEERSHWERVYALRAIGCLPGDYYFPELIDLAEDDLMRYEDALARVSSDPDKSVRLDIFEDMIDKIVDFAASQPSNREWLWECLDEADPEITCSIISKRLEIIMPQDMKFLLLHRLIALLDAHPQLLSLRLADQIYNYSKADEKAQAFLQNHSDAIVEKCITSSPDERSQYELDSAIPFDWPELKVAIFQARPDFEEKYLRDEDKLAAVRREHEEARQIDDAHKATAIWRELEALYEQANDGDYQAVWNLYRKSFNSKLSIPVRAAATHFLGKLSDLPGVSEKLAVLVRYSCDTWEGFNSPIRFEAGLALFYEGSPQAWEALIEANIASPATMHPWLFDDWIECLTDKLSGVATVYQDGGLGVENRWFKALLKEPQP